MKMIKNNPLVSVLVPIYGVEKYIEKCAVSLFEQTYKNIEYIFVNDCTKDNSLVVLDSVIQRYPAVQNVVNIIHHTTNKGLAGARITALEASKGDYILHVDSDDYVSTNAVELLVNAALKSNADIIDSAYLKVDTDGNTLSIGKPYIGSDIDYLHLIVSRSGLVNNQIWGKLIKRSLYFDYHINAVEGVNYGEDYSVFPLLLSKASRYVIEDITYYYNFGNTGSYMHNISEKNFISYLNAEKIVYDNLKSDSNLLFSLDFGKANMYLLSRKMNISVDVCKTHLPFISNYSLLNLYVWLLKYDITQLLGRALFVLIKRAKYYRLMN